MTALAKIQQRKTMLDIEFLDLPGERIPLEDGTMDTVVSTFTLGTIPGVVDAIQGMARVLKNRMASSSSLNSDFPRS